MMGPEGAVRFLRVRFPELAHLFGDPENLDPETPEPYHSYERFAEAVLRRQDDRIFLESVYAFINELAVSREYWLQEVLGVSLLESLARNAEFATALYPHLNTKAQEVLRAMEQQMCGRFRE
jgi:hypothetical protein